MLALPWMRSRAQCVAVVQACVVLGLSLCTQLRGGGCDCSWRREGLQVHRGTLSHGGVAGPHVS